MAATNVMSKITEMPRVKFISSPSLWIHGHGPDHPLKPERLRRTFELLTELECLELPGVEIIEPRLPSSSELSIFHTDEYVAAVDSLSQGDPAVHADRYNFGPGDNPIFAGMYESEGLKVGGALVAAELLFKNRCDIAFNYSGGLHHGGPDFASGFCVFNDAAVAIHWLLSKGMRIAYIDIDVHHGDGVQNAFYDDDRVLTISLHQDGRTLFPGTGFVDEIGSGSGRGFCVNIPLPPFTDDENYLWAFDQTIAPILDRFEPDLIVSQLGVDTHFLDPLANLALTTHGHIALFERLKGYSPRWLALGGGGYNLDVVPRSWTLAVCVMAGAAPPEHLPPGYVSKYGGAYLEDNEQPQINTQVREEVKKRVLEVVTRVQEIHSL